MRDRDVYVAKVDTAVALPSKATTGSWAFDVYYRSSAIIDDIIEIPPHSGPVLLMTGLFVALPFDSCMRILSRSGLAKKGLIVTNAPGIIDSDYRHEVGVMVNNISDEPIMIRNGDRVAQAEFADERGFFAPRWLAVRREDLPDTGSTRNGGFGSTGA